MDLGAHMVGDQAHDAFAVGRRKMGARFAKTFAEAVDPEPAVGIEHDLDDARIRQPACDGRPERGAQHPCAPRCLFGPGGVNDHLCPLHSARQDTRPAFGDQ